MLIVSAGVDRAWAAWIGDRLERRGLAVVHHRWDPPDGTPLVECLRELLLAPGPVLVVLSEWFFRLGPRDDDEWDTALREVVAAEPGRIVAVAVTPSGLPAAASLLSPLSLTDLGAAEAERRLLPAFGLAAPAEAARTGLGPRYPADPPAVWGGVPARNARFTGREPLLNAAYRAFQETGRRAGVVTLHGMSGVGKTQLAAEYVYRFGAEYDVVWWVPADKRVTCRQKLAELAPALGLSTGVEYGERVRAARDALRRGEPYSRWLLVLDGADEPDQLRDLVPAGPGHVLITSRNREWAEHSGTLLEVPVYDREESVAFVRRRAPRLTDGEARQLAEALEDLPLLLDQTAGWLNDSEMSVGQYIEVLQDRMDQDVVSVSADFPVAFQTAWAILLGTLRETVPESVDLLRLCTFFAPAAIPVRLIRDLPPDALPDRLRWLVEDPVRWARALGKLREYAVVRVMGTDEREASGAPGPETVPGPHGGGGDLLTMHRMVHHAVRLSMPAQDHEEFLGVARRALTAADPGDPTKVAHWPRYAEITPHLIWADALMSTDPATHTLVLNCLRHMYLSGEYAEGIDLGGHALEAWRGLLGETHPRIWDLSHHYANLMRAVGDYAGTEAIDRAAAAHLLAERGGADLEHLRAASGLAADLRGLGRYEEAFELSGWILASYRELLGPEDSRTLNARNNLAVSLRLLGRYEESRSLNRSTLEIRRRVLGPAHRWTLYSELHHAVDLRLLGRYREAETLQAESLRVHQRELGPDNPQTLRAGHNLALCRYLAGDPAGARPLFAQTLERCERVLGESDPLTLMIATSCAWLERETGDPLRALRRHTAVEERYTAMLGPGHPFTAGVLGNRGLTLLALGERRAGDEALGRAHRAMRDAVGPDHPWTVGCALNAAAARLMTGDAHGALELSRDSVASASRALGPEHPLTLVCQVGLAAALRAVRRAEEAARTEEAALSGLSATLGPRHPLTVRARGRSRTHWDFESQTI
ncbi:FxSxx-COOH system tetratricopeptide repeat protein [Streptomyces sp. NPDC002018]|uniref:FxSxx-COOH system tetratricopeptide repeat protein n=1 Tax=Streptomyces sp. NPDC002018 TaxID=3364629 RepID=UPI00367D7CC1